MKSSRLLFVVVLSAMASACGVETIVQDLNEREANDILETLATNGISADKTRVTEGRNIVYSVTVPAGSKIDAYRVLKENELPPRRDMGYKEVFAGGGLIPSASEERAKMLASLEGEIERQLKLVHGILDAQVQIVVPEESALKTTQERTAPPTASVVLKYLPDGQGHAPLGERQVAAMVAKGVEGLDPEQVYVVLTPAVPTTNHTQLTGNTGSWLGRLPQRTANMLAVAVLGLIVVLGILVAFSQVRLRTVRGRLLRLQGEIAKARRKPNEGAPSNAA